MSSSTRKEWVDAMLLIVSPVLESLSRNELKKNLPKEFHMDRFAYAPLEAFSRSMLGIAPWLENELASIEEKELQKKYRELVILCLDNATNPLSDDYMYFDKGGQNLVDTAFLAHALLRAPNALVKKLPIHIRENVIVSLKKTRQFIAYNSNWILFSAMVEAGLYVLGDEDFDKMRITYALRTFDTWYKGDGVYGDGEAFHWDYYNSFVIQPMYVDLVELFADFSDEFSRLKPKVMKRASRYATILERMIAPDGTYPIIGRSICYRFGAFQMLSQAVLQHRLETGIKPAQVRCALTAVMRRVMGAVEMFDENGWLRPGVYGYQPELAEGYINVGSLYLSSAFFLPLGLPVNDEFWQDKDEKWTSCNIWSGESVKADQAIDD